MRIQASLLAYGDQLIDLDGDAIIQFLCESLRMPEWEVATALVGENWQNGYLESNRAELVRFVKGMDRNQFPAVDVQALGLMPNARFKEAIKTSETFRAGVQHLSEGIRRGQS